MMLLRVLACALAIVVGAWFVLGARQARDTAAAQSLLSGGANLTAAQLHHARSELSAAGFLNPDRQVTVLRGELARAEGKRAESTRILKEVVRHEPDNIAAWVNLAMSDHKPADLALVLRMLAKLDPQLAHERR